MKAKRLELIGIGFEQRAEEPGAEKAQRGRNYLWLATGTTDKTPHSINKILNE